MNSNSNSSSGKILYQVGTLKYTSGKLVVMLFWMLWADLALQLMESLQTIIPIQLERIGASSTVTGLVRDSLQAFLTLLILPLIGAQSDRHRGKIGRRRPFLLFSILPVSACLVALGYAEPISHFIHGLLNPMFGGLSVKAVGICTIVLFAGGFFLFNNYTLPVYQYLIADIVPKQIMGKFIGAYRAVGAISGFLFHKLLFPHIDTRIEWIYIICTGFYALAFFLLVWQIREGEYPPPETSRKRQGPVAFVRQYARLCFSNWFYWKVYLTSFFYWVAIVPFYNFGTLYFKAAPKGNSVTSLNMFPNELGDIRAWTFLPQLLTFPIVGYLIDRYHSTRFLMVGFSGMTLCFLIACYMAFTQSPLHGVKADDAKVLVVLVPRSDRANDYERVETVKSLNDIRKAGEAFLIDHAAAGTTISIEDKLVPNPTYEEKVRGKNPIMRSCHWVYCLFTQQAYGPRKPSTEERMMVITSSNPSDGVPERVEKTISMEEIQAAGELGLCVIGAGEMPGTKKGFEDKFYNHSPRWPKVWWFGFMVVLAIIQLAYLAMQPALFPRDTYGQFFSANQWIFSIGLLLGPLVCGIVLDFFDDRRLIFVWSSVFFALATVLSISLYRHWKRLGGEEEYTPP